MQYKFCVDISPRSRKSNKNGKLAKLLFKFSRMQNLDMLYTQKRMKQKIKTLPFLVLYDVKRERTLCTFANVAYSY